MRMKTIWAAAAAAVVLAVAVPTASFAGDMENGMTEGSKARAEKSPAGARDPNDVTTTQNGNPRNTSGGASSGGTSTGVNH